MHYLRVDKTLKLPVYHQLRTGFEDAIRKGVLVHGQQLPTEEEVCQTFDISHYIIRHAYDQLMEEGLIVRIKGKGSFVSSRPIITSSLTDLQSLENRVRSMGRKVVSSVQFVELIHDDPQAYFVLGLEKDENCLHLRRILSADGHPLYLQDWFLPERHFPKIRRQLTEDVRWIDVVNHHVRISSIQNLYSTKIATLVEAQCLNLAVNDPLFINRSHLLDESGRPVAFVITAYPGDYIRLEVQP